MKLRLLFILLVSQIGFAQRTCGTDQKMQEIMSNPVLLQQHLAQQAKFQSELQNTMLHRDGAGTNIVIKIPVAVHFPSGNNANRACLVSLAQSQVDVLNADFNAANADISNWAAASSFYPGVNTGNLEVQFQLATMNHPAGTDPNLVEGQPAVTVGYNYGGGSDSDIKWKGYLNFLVKNIPGNTLGYSPLGGLPINGNAVVINRNAFGKGLSCPGSFTPTAPYNLGRTVTHELGHFFNLAHTFGNGNGCVVNNTDNVSDTPKVGAPTYGCPSVGGVASCVAGQPALTMNFMDYVNDPCMYMFTEGQKQRMLSYHNSIASQFQPNVLRVNETTANAFSVYPNPSNGNFTIGFKEVLPSYSVTICDMTGRKVYTKSTNQNSDIIQNVEISGFSKGIYMVSITADNKTTTKKIVIR